MGLGYRGELDVDGLVWLRNRAYDPATRAFLPPDPLPPSPGPPTPPTPTTTPATTRSTTSTRSGCARSPTPSSPAEHDSGGGLLSSIGHGLLDVAGLVPVVGEAADLANAAWYTAEGDYIMAGLSAAAAIPFAAGGPPAPRA